MSVLGRWICVALLGLFSCARAATAEDVGGSNASVWPGFRGSGTSVTSANELPIHWSDEQGIVWRVDLPGYGQSSPVVWNDRVFVTTMQGDLKETATVLCFDLNSGEQIWHREFVSTQQIEASNYVTRSAPTPVLDSRRVYVFFESGDLLALDHNGETAWERSLASEYGEFQGNHGVGSSLAATDDAVIVLVNHDGPSYLMAVNKNDGKNLWKVDYEARVAWSSPIVAQHEGTSIVVVSAAGMVEAYDAASGKKLWQIGGLPGANVPSATVAGDMVFIGAKDVASNVAIRMGDDKTKSPADIVWRSQQASCSFCSPLHYRGQVYFVNRAGVAFSVDETSGELIWKHRLGDSCWASPLAAEDRTYFFTKSGKTVVTRDGPKHEILASNTLTIDAKTRIYGVAAVRRKFILRTGDELICVGTQVK